MGASNIEYCDMVWNPVTGCTPISAGCDNCWAQAYLKRFGQPTDVTLYNDRLDEPLRWRKPQTVFVCSQGDLFHEDVPTQFLIKIFMKMVGTPEHTYLLLTKRPERLARLSWTVGNNIWIGVSVEDQATADDRIPKLLANVSPAHRWLSIEPMLGPVNLLSDAREYLGYEDQPAGSLLGTEVYPGLDWVVVGGESGPGARPMHPDWARSVRDQCQEADVSFMFKQWGEWGPHRVEHILYPDKAGKLVESTVACSSDRKRVGAMHYWAYPPICNGSFGRLDIMERVGKKKAGRLLDGVLHDDIPEVVK